MAYMNFSLYTVKHARQLMVLKPLYLSTPRLCTLTEPLRLIAFNRRKVPNANSNLDRVLPAKGHHPPTFSRVSHARRRENLPKRHAPTTQRPQFELWVPPVSLSRCILYHLVFSPLSKRRGAKKREKFGEKRVVFFPLFSALLASSVLLYSPLLPRIGVLGVLLGMAWGL